MRRAGKNPKRVGADFHLKLASQKQDSDDWYVGWQIVCFHNAYITVQPKIFT